MVGQCMLLGLLAVLSRADIRTKKLPLAAMGIFGAAGIGVFLWKRPWPVINLLGGAAIGGFLLICSFLSREAIGKGDGYLFCVTGIFLGFQKNIFLLMTAMILCAVYSFVLLITKRCDKTDRIAFVPFVLAAYLLLLGG